MKVLDLFCGMGGWTVPFWYAGDYCVGVDAVNSGYPAKFIKIDVRNLNGKKFRGFDLVIGSPPCSEFSISKVRNNEARKKGRNIENGLSLIREFERVVKEAEPWFYCMENVEALTKYYDKQPQTRFMISKGGRRCLWTNIPLPSFIEFYPQHKIREIYGWERQRWWRSFIPYPVARFVADAVKKELIN